MNVSPLIDDIISFWSSGKRYKKILINQNTISVSDGSRDNLIPHVTPKLGNVERLIAGACWDEKIAVVLDRADYVPLGRSKLLDAIHATGGGPLDYVIICICENFFDLPNRIRAHMDYIFQHSPTESQFHHYYDRLIRGVSPNNCKPYSSGTKYRIIGSDDYIVYGLVKENLKWYRPRSCLTSKVDVTDAVVQLSIVEEEHDKCDRIFDFEKRRSFRALAILGVSPAEEKCVSDQWLPTDRIQIVASKSRLWVFDKTADKTVVSVANWTANTLYRVMRFSSKMSPSTKKVLKYIDFGDQDWENDLIREAIETAHLYDIQVVFITRNYMSFPNGAIQRVDYLLQYKPSEIALRYVDDLIFGEELGLPNSMGDHDSVVYDPREERRYLHRTPINGSDRNSGTLSGVGTGAVATGPCETQTETSDTSNLENAKEAYPVAICGRELADGGCYVSTSPVATRLHTTQTETPHVFDFESAKGVHVVSICGTELRDARLLTDHILDKWMGPGSLVVCLKDGIQMHIYRKIFTGLHEADNKEYTIRFESFDDALQAIVEKIESSPNLIDSKYNWAVVFNTMPGCFHNYRIIPSLTISRGLIVFVVGGMQEMAPVYRAMVDHIFVRNDDVETFEQQHKESLSANQCGRVDLKVAQGRIVSYRAYRR
jgi:hypothetical protein